MFLTTPIKRVIYGMSFFCPICLREETLTSRNGEDLSIWSKDDMELPSKNPESLPTNSTSTSTAASAISLESGSTTLASPASPAYTPDGIQFGSGITAALITDGARAVGAFCRPFPVATVGTIKQADFDIASATFKLTVKVRPEDFTASDLTTEIYLPFVHYAKTLTKEYHDDKKASQALELDVDIDTTKGSCTTQGQYLTWTYPKPTSETTYTIIVKRKGGAIVRDTGYTQGGGSWSDVCGGCVIS
jgi:hypothetical protein